MNMPAGIRQLQLTIEAYPYYHCRNNECGRYGKGIGKEKVEKEFCTLLKLLTPSSQILKVAEAMARDIHSKKQKEVSSHSNSMKSRLAGIQKEIEGFLDKVIGCSSPTVVKAYEEKIERLEEEKDRVQETIEKMVGMKMNVAESVGTAIEFLSKPYKIWEKGDLEVKRTVMSIAFAKKITFDKIEGFGTAELSLPYRVLGEFKNRDIGLVVGSGVGANQLVDFLDALNDMGKVFENPPRLDGKAFKFEPLALAA